MGVPSKEQLIKKAGDPKVLPSVARKVLEMVNNADTSNSQLCSVIEKDQTISASILKIANSAFYGLRQEVTSLNQAIVILGFNALRDLVITVSTKLQYKNFGITEQMMWDHSIGAAIAAKRIAAGRGKDLEEIAFLGGLMHDFGKVVMNNEAPDAYLQVMQDSYNEGIQPMAAEDNVFGYNHTEIGPLVLSEWGFPPMLIEVLKNHHLNYCSLEDFEDGLAARAVACCHLANCICKKIGIGYRTPDDSVDLASLPSVAFLAIAPDKLDPMLNEIAEAYEAEKAAFQ